MKHQMFSHLFHPDPLAFIMIGVILTIGATVTCFSSRYMKGGRHYYSFMGLLMALIIFLSVMVCADNLFLLLSLWGICNILLVKLMVHESKWLAAKASGVIAARTFIFGFICIGLGFFILYADHQNASINYIVHSKHSSPNIDIALMLILIGAMTQSGLWPFHRWLISSLNSPTPISAIMHAGLVNGGGFLLARFSPLYIVHPFILTSIFLIGLFSAIAGTFWKLMQNDVKRMLACSTMGQMGFMFAQCGMGLFPAAIAHLCFHGFFKANLFLSSPGVINEKRLSINNIVNFKSFLIAFLCGLIGLQFFSLISDISYIKYNTNLIMVALFLIVCTQSALTFLFENHFKNILISLIFSIFLGTLYGFMIKIIRNILNGDFSYPAPAMNIFYVFGLIILIACWLMFLLYPLIKNKNLIPDKVSFYIYMNALNASQPHPKTITSNRNDYSFD